MPPNPVGAGGTWTQTVNKDAAISGEEFDKKQIELIQKVDRLFQSDDRDEGLVRTDQRRQQARCAASSTSSGRAGFASTTVRPAGS